VKANRTFKIIGRYSDRCRFHKGKIGTQAKKSVYTSLGDYERHAEKTSTRWNDFCGFDVEHYELVNGEWVCLVGRFAI